MIKVSPSGIGMLLECPRCLWLYANEKISRPAGIFPSLPSGMDEIFKKYFDSYRAKDKLPPEIAGKVDGTLFDDFTRLNKYRNINFGKGGLKTVFPKYSIRLQGAVDELLVNEKKEYIPLDFKTRGYPTKENTHQHYQHQLDLYALLLEKNNLRPSPFGYLLFFWPKEFKEGQATFATKLVRMAISANAGLNVLKKVHQIVSRPKPSTHADCEYCLYRAVGEHFEE